MAMPRLSLSVYSVLLFGLAVETVLSVDKFKREDFPPDFVFGSGTSAYQVEGAAFEDGRTPSIWDTYVHAGYFHGGNGDVACDGYHKYKEDIQLMVETGLEAYRFSISWSRLIPNGRGPINPKGLQFYNNFIDELIRNGIEPHVTLFHNDLPQALEDEYGGWLSRKSMKDFIAFADVCFREFGDRVLHWTTFNEPNAFALAGYDMGLIPPARCSSPFGPNCIQGNSSWEPYMVAHNILLAHASASSLYHKKYKAKQHGMVGLNLLAYWFTPYTNTTEDVIAAQRTIDFWVGWFLNPLVFGDYPNIVKKNAGKRIPAFTKDESTRIKGSIDFIAVNHYDTLYVKDKSSNLETDNRDLSADMAVEIVFFEGYMPPFQVDLNPWGLQALLEYFKRAYGNPPVYIHENGYRTTRNGTLDDEPRVEFTHGFIGSLLDAVRNGSNARGYFIWSFLDVFELLDGYESSYGLYYVDLDDKDLKRYPKSSAKWYSKFLKGTSVGPKEALGLEIEKNISAPSQSHFSQ